MPKRKVRADHGDGCGGKRQSCGTDSEEYVLLSAFDDPEKLVEVKLSLLKQADCRLSKMITHQAPSTRRGVPFWRSSMTKAMLTTFVRSLLAGELVLTKGVTVGEALATFEYEGVMLQSSRHPMTRPRPGIAFSKADGRVSDLVSSLCAQVADALLQWPRLETVLDSVIGRNDEEVNYSKLALANISATPTRVWVRFAGRPKTPEANGADFALALAQKPPRWLAEGVGALGVVHHIIAQTDAAFKTQRDEAAFKRLHRAVDGGPLGPFYGVLHDFVRSCAAPESRHLLKKGERFFSECRASLLNAAPDAGPSLAVQYSRAVFTLVENSLWPPFPDCSRVFGSACADEGGQTPERGELKRALKARGIQVVRWSDERDPNVRPLVFPPSWREGGATCYGPAVLLDFQQIR
jgi:hypothetical protein